VAPPGRGDPPLASSGFEQLAFNSSPYRGPSPWQKTHIHPGPPKELQTPATINMTGHVDGFSRFSLAMIQLQPGTEDKSKNLAHTRGMIIRAFEGDGDASRKPDLIMLPVGQRLERLYSSLRRNTLTPQSPTQPIKRTPSSSQTCNQAAPLGPRTSLRTVLP
jgi:hypothetical protein